MLFVKFHSRNDIQPVLLQLPVGRQSFAERILRDAHRYGWRDFYVHPMAIGNDPNEADLCGTNPATGDHDFLLVGGGRESEAVNEHG